MSSQGPTPQHSRRSTMEFSSPDGRRFSKSSSYNDPSTPTRHSFSNGDGMDTFSNSGISGDGGDGGGGGVGGGGDGGLGGLGNLADELADALSDGDDDDDMDGEGEYYEDEEGAPSRGDVDLPDINLSEAAGDENGTGIKDGSSGEQRDSGVDVTASPGGTSHRARGDNSSLSLPAANGGRSRHHNHHRRVDSMYDGSDYGSDSDLDTPGMPPSLVAKMDAVESLARRGTEDNGGPTDGVCRRLIEELRDLGSQANVEGGATRLITAHSALTTHLAHQTRQLHALAFPLFSPLTMSPFGVAPLIITSGGIGSSHAIRGGGGGSNPSPVIRGGGNDNNDGNDGNDNEEEEDDDTFSPMLAALADQMPRPSTAAYQSLAALHGLTGDLVATLSYLSDTLHMARQTTTTATRRLRSAKELVAELRRDEELREEGERWLERGNWDERLRRRECAHVCGEVVGGFEEVCNGWRARLLAQAEATQAS